MHPEHVQYVQQLVSALSLPLQSLEEPKEKYYPEEQRSKGTIEQDELIPHIDKFLQDKQYKPKGFSEKRYSRLLDLSKRFVRYEGRLYRRGRDSQHRLYVRKENRMYMMTAAHDHNGHRGFFATKSLLTQRFWWPEMERDINWFVKTCHNCQELGHDMGL